MHRIEVKVCMATHCHFAGAETIVEMLEDDADLAEFIDVQCVPCLEKTCEGGRGSPVVEVGGHRMMRATPESIIEKIEEMVTGAITGTTSGTASGTREGTAGTPKGTPRSEARHA